MKKLHVVRRGFNSRRPFRKLNSVTELVGKEVEVQDADQLIQSEIDEVSVDKTGDATLTLSTGDEVVIDSAEAAELIETGDVVVEEDAPAVPDEFEVTREVVDADGNASEVTTTVEAENEGEALQQVTLLDSRRKRNSRNYRARNKNSEAEKPAAEDPEDETAKEPETKEFKVTRVADCDGKKVRKTASVTAPNIEEAIDAVKAADAHNEIQADGYEELVEKEPTSTVTINSDVDEVIEVPASEKPADEDPDEDPEPAPTVQIEVPASEETSEDPNEDPEPTPTVQTKVPASEKPADEDPDEDPEPDRESNSFKGVSAFVKRKYGVDL